MGSVGNTSSPEPKRNIMESAETLGHYINAERYNKQKAAGVTRTWADNRMYTYDIDGKQITTNYGASEYTYWDGNGTSRSRVVSVGNRSAADVLKDMIEAGYTKIQFKYTTTRVRGWHNYYAFCSGKES